MLSTVAMLVCSALCVAGSQQSVQVTGATPEITTVIQQAHVPLPPTITVVDGTGWETADAQGNPIIGLPLTPDMAPTWALDPNFKMFSFDYNYGRRTDFTGPTESLMRFVTMHELGHVFDDEVLTPSERDTFKRIARIPASVGWGDPPNAPAEKFAEAYRLCDLIGPRLPSVTWRYIGYEWAPTPKQHRLACTLIRNAAGLQ